MFTRKKSTVVCSVLGLINGLFIIFMFFVILPDAPSVTIFHIFLLLFGLSLTVTGLLILFKNHGAYIRVKDKHISARYNWGKRLECEVSDIRFVDIGVDSLIIELSNGRHYTIPDLENELSLCTHIRDLMGYKPSTANIVELRKKYDSSTKIHRRVYRICLSVVIISVICVLACIFGTGNRDFNELLHRDWIIIDISAAVILISWIIMFVVIFRYGKTLRERPIILFEIQKLVLEQTPPPPGKFIKAYADTFYNLRYTVLGVPDSEKVYCVVEVFCDNLTLLKDYETDEYDSLDELAAQELEGTHEIIISNTI